MQTEEGVPDLAGERDERIKMLNNSRIRDLENRDKHLSSFGASKVEVHEIFFTF